MAFHILLFDASEILTSYDKESPNVFQKDSYNFNQFHTSQVVCRVVFQVQFQAKSLAERCTQKDTSYGAWSQKGFF